MRIHQRNKAPLTAGAATALTALLALGFGCSKTETPEEGTAPETSSTQRVTVASEPEWRPPGFEESDATNAGTVPVPTVGATNDESATAITAPSEQQSTNLQRIVKWEKHYAAAHTFDDRFEAAVQIGEVGTVEAIRTLERLFRKERDTETRVELINALIGISDHKPERLAFLKLGIRPEQPPEVREAAIDGLVDLEDAMAFEPLKDLFDDPDPEIAELAKQSYGLVEDMVRSP